MKRIGKIILYVIGGLFAIGLLGAIFGDKDSNRSSMASSAETTEAKRVKQWTEVFRFKGNGEKKSASFRLHGNNARLKYTYNAEADYAAIFNAYVVPHGQDIMKTGGFPEVMIQESEQSETYIQKADGEYYLNVNGLGKWEVVVEEEM